MIYFAWLPSHRGFVLDLPHEQSAILSLVIRFPSAS
jgi:hypothetical protein